MPNSNVKIVATLLIIAGWGIGQAHAGDFGVSFRYGSRTYCPPRASTYSYVYRAPTYAYYEPRTYVYTAPSSYVYTEPVSYIYNDSLYYTYNQPRTYVYTEPSLYVSPPAVTYVSSPVYTTTYTRSDCYRYPARGGSVSIRYDRDRCDSRDRRRSYGYAYRPAPRVERSCYTPSSGGLRVSIGRNQDARRTISASPQRYTPRIEFRDNRSSSDRARGDRHRDGRSHRPPRIENGRR